MRARPRQSVLLRRSALRMSAVLLVGAVSVTLAGCTSGGSPKPTASPGATKALSVVRVDAFLGAGGALLQHAASGAGAGRTVQWLQVTDTGTAYTSLSAGSADAALVSTVVPKGYTPASGGKKVVALGPIFRMADAFYSKKVKKIADLGDGARVALPTSSTDLASALKLLAGAGLITVTPGETGLKSIATNSKNLQFTTVSTAKIVAALKTHDAVFMSANTAIGLDVAPSSAILVEPSADMTTEQFITTAADRSTPAVKALYATLTSASTRAFIAKQWKGIVAPIAD